MWKSSLRLSAWTLALTLALAAPLKAQPSQVGDWSDVIDWPLEAIHATMLPTGKVMVWQTWTQSVGLWDPTTQQFSQPAIPSINIFCAGHAWLPDGRLFVAGGHIANNVGENAANIYDPFTDSWASNVTPMNAGRWYPSATTLGDGRVLVMSGDIAVGANNTIPQIYDAATNSWQTLTGAAKQLPLYPKTFLSPDGSVVSLSNYGDTTEAVNLTGNGSWSYLGNTARPNLHNFGPAVMYEPGKAAFFGGGHDPTDDITILDLNAANPTWRVANDPMAQPRRQNDATILADGTVLITGGSSVVGWNEPAGRIPIAELWDPATEQTTQVAAASNVYRGYHSTATLLPDGRVLITGGDHVDDTGGFQNNLNAEIYSPAYLFNGARPTITGAPASAELGTTVFVQTPDAASIEDITFIVPSSTTHSQNWTQRINRLDFAVVPGGLNVVLPTNPNEAPPGYYMMFLLNDAGVPSVAEFVRADLRTSLIGDFNDDSNYACDDVNALVADVAGGTHSAPFDLTGDGLVTYADVEAWLQHAGAANLASGNAYLPGDANLDGVVDGQDFIAWNDNKFTTLAQWCGGDFNADGFVDGNDFIIWNEHKFQAADAMAVPEPSYWAVILIWSLGLAVRPGRHR